MRSRTKQRVAVVTDSTASLPPEVVAERGITVLPLQIVIGATSYDEGHPLATPAKLAQALKEWTPVSTSRPNPEAFAAIYKQLARDGYTDVVSVHVSGELSGTFDSARLAGIKIPPRVHAVDARQVGIGTGYAALAACDAIDSGATADEAAAIAAKQGAAVTTLLYVDTLEYLRRGGRVSAAQAVLGSALAVKPLLAVRDGLIVPRERVRTAGKALARLQELAIEAAGDRRVRVAVSHLANADRAQVLADGLAAALPQLVDGTVRVGEVGAVLGAHVGPGMVAVTVSPELVD